MPALRYTKSSPPPTASDEIVRESSDWAIQKAYWEDTASVYNESHVCSGDEHYKALDHVLAACRQRGVHTVLDVGVGTGRGTAYLREHGLSAIGVEPVKELVQHAISEGGVPHSSLVQGSALNLPFKNGSFDAVCATGVLHHIRDPNSAVAEMARVARRAIFISDSNRFGQGSPVMRYTKLALSRLRLWTLVETIRTSGKRYHVSEGDGLFYSYSVYDSLSTVAQWADHITLEATDGGVSRSWVQPLLTAPHVLLTAVRTDPGAPGS